jgi:membrane protein implicated in regulation of membrane protease activity
MDDWVWWLLGAIAASAGEIATTGFFLAPFAMGATVAMVLSLAGAGAAVTIPVFVAVTGLCFLFLRPVVRRHLTHPPLLRSGTAALVGRPATVLERIANVENVGSVRIDGDVWTARSYDDDEVIEAGTRVHIVEIRGATALVTE